jgi:Ca2+-binding EF-hand superfamily protein
MNMSIGGSLTAQISQTRAQMQSASEMAAVEVASFDTDGDGSIAIAEVETHDDAGRLSEQFSNIDIDSNGLVTEDELTAHHEEMQSGDRPPPPPPPPEGGETSTMSAESLIMSLFETDTDEDAVDFTSYTAATDIEEAYDLVKDLFAA